MFGETKKLQDKVLELQAKVIDIDDLKASHKREVDTIKHDHKLEMESLKFEMKNFKDSEILDKNKEIEKLTNSNAVLTKEIEMMKQMVDINADIVDVKDIINKLIEKLPQLNLTSLVVSGGNNKD